MNTTDIRAAIEAGDVNQVQILASANGSMHALWNVAMDAQHGAMGSKSAEPSKARMLYLLGRYERFGFC